MDQKPLDTEPRHSVGIVCRWTGLKPDRLRAWQRRYDVVQPSRSGGKQRLYSDADVERLQLLHQATSAGHRIAAIATLPMADLRELVAKEVSAPVIPRPTARERRDAAAGPQACLAAVQQMDAAGLRRELERWSGELPGLALAEELLAPLVHRIGELWADGGLQPAHEHLATAVLLRFIDERRDGHAVIEDAPAILIGTLQGQRHDLGALLAAETAAASGWNTVYLGPDLPAAGIAAAARQTGVEMVGLSFVYPTDDPAVAGELERLRAHLGPDVEVIAGGAAAAAYEDSLAAIGATRVDDLAELGDLLRGHRG